ncbi:MAG: hypothetical protein ACHQ49_08270 [Elusimicrobiota bacterium]
MSLRPIALLSAFAVLGCAGPKSQVLQDAGEFPSHRCVGVAPFVDPRGRGQAVADAIEAALQQRMFEPVDQKALADVLVANMPDRTSRLGLEALEKIRAKSPVDAILFGRLTPDWSAAMITVNETETGVPILQAVLLPRDRKAAFSDADDVAREAVRVLTSLRRQ